MASRGLVGRNGRPRLNPLIGLVAIAVCTLTSCDRIGDMVEARVMGGAELDDAAVRSFQTDYGCEEARVVERGRWCVYLRRVQGCGHTEEYHNVSGTMRHSSKSGVGGWCDEGLF